MSFQLQSSDGVTFVVAKEDEVGKYSDFIARSLEALRHKNEPSSSTPLIYVGSIHSSTLVWVVKWLTTSVSHHLVDNEDFQGLDLIALHELTKAAHSLEIPELFEWATLQMTKILSESKAVGAALGEKRVSKCSSTPKQVNLGKVVVFPSDEETATTPVSTLLSPPMKQVLTVNCEDFITLFPHKPVFIDLLPEEVWEQVLQKLSNQEDSEEALLHCRHVDPMWKRLVDKLSPHYLWDHWSSLESYQQPHMKTVATHFACNSDINKFLLKMSQLHPEDQERNPFRKRTVYIDHYTYPRFEEESSFREKILELLKVHGHHVKLLFHGISKNLEYLHEMLSHMNKLKTLVVFRNSNWSPDNQLTTKDFKLKYQIPELIIYSFHFQKDEDDYIAVPICSKLSSCFSGAHVKMLTLDEFASTEIAMFEFFPNLESFRAEILRVIDISYFSEPSTFSFPKLKRLSINIFKDENSAEFGNWLMPFLACFASSLELLALKFNEPEKEYECSSNSDEEIIDPDVQAPTRFLNVQQFLLPDWILRLDHNDIMIDRRFNMELPSLRNITFGSINDTSNSRRSKCEIEEMGERMWPVIPPSVETLTVRVLKYNEEFREIPFPVIVQCKRSPVL